LKIADPATNVVAPAAAHGPAVFASTPPSTSSAGPSPMRPRRVGDPLERALDERLAAPAGVDRHAQGEVDRKGQRLERRPRVERDARRGAGLADAVEREVDVRVASTWKVTWSAPGLDELLDVALGPVDHQVDVEHGVARQRLAQGADDDRART
jgi:hypothetical protein